MSPAPGSPLYSFGSGSLYAVVVAGAGYNAPATPFRVGTLQDVSIDVASEVKELYGKKTLPEAVRRGKTKLQGKAKNGRFNGRFFNQIFFGQSVTEGQMEMVQDEEQHTLGGQTVGQVLTAAIGVAGTGYSVGDIVTITGGGGTGATVKVLTAPGGVPGSVSLLTGGIGYTAGTDATSGGTGTGLTITTTVSAGVAPTVTVTNAASYFADLGVAYGTGEVSFDKIGTAPTNTQVGEYSVNLSGTFSFAANDANLVVLISYMYASMTTGYSQTITNFNMGSSPIFQAVFSQNDNGNQMAVVLRNCIMTKYTMQSKLDDFTIPEFDFSAFADSNQNVFDVYSAQ